MGEKPLKYSTEITNEYFYKYRNLPGSGPDWDSFVPIDKKYLPRDMWYPNDKHMITKTMDGFIYGSIIGIGSGLLMVNDQTLFRWSLRSNWPVMAEVFFKHYTPWALSGVVYGLGTSVSTNYRNKEDAVNHFIGGLGAGSVLGMWYKSTRASFGLALIFGLGSYGIKQLQDTGGETTGDLRRLRLFNAYRRTWFTDPIPVEGTEDDQKKYYRP